MEGLRYVIMPGQWPEKEKESVYREVYRCWEQTWTEAFNELGKPPGFLKSDAFTRQDFIGAVFKENECLALCFYRWADPKMETFSKDSYFSNWGETHIMKLRSHGDHIIVCSNFTVAKNARRTTLGFSMKDLLMGLVAKTFLHSGAEGMTAALRRDRNVQGACGKWGAEQIAYEVPSGHGDTVELMGFFHDVIASHPPQDLSGLVEELWESRMVVLDRREVYPLAELQKAA